MAPLGHTLALLAMAVATAAVEVPLDMAQDSFDDQYLECSVTMTMKFRKLQRSDFLENEGFEKNWEMATAQWQKRGSVSSPLTPDQAIALMAYTMKYMFLYEEFNYAVLKAGRSSWEYQNEFHFKSLHFLLTRALQTLRRPGECQEVSWELINYQYNGKKGDTVRFGRFVLSSESKIVLQQLGRVTMFKVYTCHGVDIHKFSMNPSQKEVLIPPFETFKVTGVSEEGNMMHIELRSIGTFSNYNCEWLKGDIMEETIMGTTIRETTSWEDEEHPVPGGSLPRNSPHLGGLLLATVAMAVVTGTL